MSKLQCGNAVKSADEDWKVFRKDTEAGRLLSRLYGVASTSQHAPVNYPKIKISTEKEEELHQRSQWSIKNTSSGRDENKSATMVSVPRFGTNKQKEIKCKNHVSRIPRRKPHNACLNEIHDNRALNETYRPPHNGFLTNSTTEKDILCDAFQYGDGCALPKAALPSEELREKYKQRSIPAHNGGIETISSVSDLTSSSKVAMQIVKEIEERREFQASMEDNCAGDTSRNKIVEEISTRLKELMKIDPILARSLMK
uniref:Uncharacterized protein n=1 Tax=Chaetoceros debilis TaxID=122233 RepID=A0A6S8RH26_9STRA|mmetsp:Transcript_10251/g.15482  ORF Transcript_10251/g.15482 Transcript_10251/m.15482 type:complete len:256 (+) Transcript_10251:39-806(+)